MIDILAKIPGASSSIVILGGHYDTKRSAIPFVGADDGGSSAAFLVEMERALALEKHNLTYWLVFFS
jgi:Zn-dependent M28 family amino/carboxypeptidase